MEETKTIIGFTDGYFFVGKKFDDILTDCLAIVFSNSDGGNGINLVNPIPFSLVRRKSNVMYIPSIPLSKFLYTIDLKEDVEDGEDFISYYRDNLNQELNKIKKEEKICDVNTGETKNG